MKQEIDRKNSEKKEMMKEAERKSVQINNKRSKVNTFNKIFVFFVCSLT